jgi:NADPH-dependent glutamate synthase beta subunit-like oxidoreductase
MSLPDDFLAPEVIAAAREVIRREGRENYPACPIGIEGVLDELTKKFGDQFVSPDMYKLLDLIYELWADPDIDLVTPEGWIEFVCNKELGQADVTELKAVRGDE